jgi:hypothetical protein
MHKALPEGALLFQENKTNIPRGYGVECQTLLLSCISPEAVRAQDGPEYPENR